MGHSTTPAGVALQSHIYLAQGGVPNLRQLHAFLCDTLLMTGFGFAPPETTPSWGILDRAARRTRRPDDRGALLPRPAPGRQHRLRRGAVPGHRGRRRSAAAGVLRVAAHSRRRTARPAQHRRRDGDHGAGRRRRHTRHRHGRRQRRQLERGPSGRAGHPDPAGPVPDQFPRAVAGQRRRAVAARRRHPGRGAGVRRSHHHGSVLVQGDRRRGPDLLCRRSGTLRPRRRAGRQTRPAARDSRPPQKRVAVVFSAYPTKHARIGNAVGLDTPASAVALLRAMRDAGYDDRRRSRRGRRGRRRVDPRADRARRPGSGLAHRRAAEGNPIRLPAKDYRDWFATLPPSSPTSSSSTGARRRASCSSTAVRIPTARS